jgi:hypothetical protein
LQALWEPNGSASWIVSAADASRPDDEWIVDLRAPGH